MNDSTDPASEYDCETMMQLGVGARVILWQGARTDFYDLELRQQAQLLAYMGLWVESRRMGDKQFNGNEGRVKNTNRMVQAFKIHKVRGYGIVLSLGDRKTFVILDWDSAKKDNKAKARILDRVKLRAESFEVKYGKR